MSKLLEEAFRADFARIFLVGVLCDTSPALEGGLLAWGEEGLDLDPLFPLPLDFNSKGGEPRGRITDWDRPRITEAALVLDLRLAPEVETERVGVVEGNNLRPRIGLGTSEFFRGNFETGR